MMLVLIFMMQPKIFAQELLCFLFLTYRFERNPQAIWGWVCNSLLAELFYREGHADRCACPVPCKTTSYISTPWVTFAYTSQYDLQNILQVNNQFTLTRFPHGRSQNTVPIASTQAAIKGIVQYSTTHTHTHTLAAVGSQLQSRAHAQRSRSRRTCRVAHRLVMTSCTYVSAINITSFIQCIRCVQT